MADDDSVDYWLNGSYDVSGSVLHWCDHKPVSLHVDPNSHRCSCGIGHDHTAAVYDEMMAG